MPRPLAAKSANSLAGIPNSNELDSSPVIKGFVCTRWPPESVHSGSDLDLVAFTFTLRVGFDGSAFAGGLGGALSFAAFTFLFLFL